jgi:glycosyltransferase involved in cell wall biosynthesis
MEITTIIPTHNRAHFIKRAIRSALEQTHPHIKVIVYDNASQDNTEEIVSLFARNDSRVNYVKHSQPISAVENFQFGISKVETPFFSFLADDDILLPNFYQQGLDTLSNHPDAACFLGSAIDLHTSGKILAANAMSWPDQEYFPASDALPYIIGHYVNWTAAIFRTKSAQSMRLNPRLKTIDYDYLVRMNARYPLVFSKRPCALFIHHPNSYSVQNGLKILYSSWNILSETMNADPLLSCQAKKDLENLLISDFNHRLFRMAISSFFDGNFSQFLEISQKRPIFFLRVLFLFRIPIIFGCLRKTYSFLRYLKRRPLQKKYGWVSTYLDMQ